MSLPKTPCALRNPLPSGIARSSLDQERSRPRPASGRAAASAPDMLAGTCALSLFRPPAWTKGRRPRIRDRLLPMLNGTVEWIKPVPLYWARDFRRAGKRDSGGVLRESNTPMIALTAGSRLRRGRLSLDRVVQTQHLHATRNLGCCRSTLPASARRREGAAGLPRTRRLDEGELRVGSGHRAQC